MTDFYRFPAMAKLKEWEAFDQIECIREEIDEAITAKQEHERQAYGIELLDVIHATETALRMEFSEQEVKELQRRVIEKNKMRGYYDE